MGNGQAAKDDNNAPAVAGWDATGHQIATVEIVSVSTDATTGVKHGALNVNATFSASSLSINDPTTTSQKAGVNAGGSLQVAGQGIAGTPAGGVVTIQGVAGGTAVPVSGSISATNPSVGTDGSAIPTSSTLVGASDGTNLQQLLVESASNRNLRTGIYSGANEATVTGANALKVDGSAATQPVSGTFWQATQPVSGTVSVNALPAGANLIGSIELVDSAGSNKATISASGAVKVDNSAVTQPVSAASLPLPTGASTAAKQPALGTAGTASTDVLSVQGITSMTALKVDGSGVTQPVSGTVTSNAGSGNFTVAQATGSNLHTVLDSGSTTAATQATAANLNATATIQVVTGTSLAADQSNSELRISNYGKNSVAGDTAITVNSAGNVKTTGDFAEQSGLSAGALNADLVASTDVSGYAWLSLHITAIATGGTLTFQASNDNFATQIESVNLARVSSSTTAAATTTNTGIYEGPVNFRYFRARQTAWTSGSTTGVLELFTIPRVLNTAPVSANQAGTWTVQPGNTANTTAWKVDGSAVTQPISQATAASLNATATIQAVTGTSLAVGNNALPILTSAVSGYVAAYGSNAAALTSSTDYSFKWGAGGTTQINHLMIQNNTSTNLNFELDVAATAGSPILAPGATIFFDVQTLIVHLFQAGTPNVNGSTAGNIVAKGWL